jgi:catechol 2,3-dioxygenase-like lactoylglutathione lyase family enzyme
MFDFKRLDHVLICVPVGKKQEARVFYSEVLGLVEIPGEHPRGSLWFEIAGIQLHVQEEDGGNFSARHFAIEIENLAKATEYLERMEIPLAYSSKIEGRERLFFRDPFDNRIELIEYS